MFTKSEIIEMIRNNDMSRFYNDRYWRNLSHKVIAENNNECHLCRLQKKYSRAVIVHHVKHLKKRPDLAYSRTYKDKDGEHIQLMPLCFDCHESIHERGKYAKSRKFTNTERW